MDKDIRDDVGLLLRKGLTKDDIQKGIINEYECSSCGGLYARSEEEAEGEDFACPRCEASLELKSRDIGKTLGIVAKKCKDKSKWYYIQRAKKKAVKKMAKLDLNKEEQSVIRKYVAKKKGGEKEYKRGLWGRKIKSKGKGRGLGVGEGRGPIGRNR